LAWPVRLLLHLLPIGILGLCILVLIVVDIFSSPTNPKGGGAGDDAIEKDAYVMLKFDEGLLDRDYSDSMSFAIHKIDPTNKAAGSVRLNWYPNGAGNSVVAMIDGKEAVFGEIPGAGKWA